MKKKIAGSTKAKTKSTESNKMSTKPNPVLPLKIIDGFLNEALDMNAIDNIYMVKSHFLWTREDNVERYRINVWLEEEVDNLDLGRRYIGHSFFVKYDVKAKKILDEYIGR